MNVAVLIPIVAVLVNLAMAAYVAGLNFRNPINRAFIYLSLMLVFWGLSDALLWSLQDKESLYITARIQSMIYTQSGITILNLFYQYIRRKRDLIFYYTFTVCLLLAVAGALSPWLVADVQFMSWGVSQVPGPLYYPGAIFSTVIPVSFGVYLLIKHYLCITTQNERSRGRLFISGVLLALSISWSFDLIVPLVWQQELPPQTHIAGIVLQLFVFIAILKHQLFSIDMPHVAREIFANAREGVALIQHGQVIEVNTPAQTMVKPFVEKSIDDALLEFGKRCLLSNQAQIETLIEHDGALYALNLSAIEVTGKGVGTGTILFLRDITNSKRIEQKIRQMNQELIHARDKAVEANIAKSQFFASLSHELRTPLNAILGFSDLALERIRRLGNLELIDDIETVHQSGKHMLDILNSVLDLSRLEAGKVELYPESFDLRELINTTYHALKQLLAQNNNQLLIACDPNISEIYSDQVKIQQILLNLLSNACKFTENGTIKLHCRKRESGRPEYEISVSDTGIGMHQAQITRLFEPYQLFDNGAFVKNRGTGLGLIICKRLSQMLNGDIAVHSIPGQGSVFTLVLPVNLEA